METKVGIGFDIHRLVEGRPLWVGGIEIPYVLGALGHSDGDVLAHAVCDALLGAIAQGDIGEHFPDTDPALTGISSLKLLEKVMAIVKQNQYAVGNVDVVLIAQEPNFTPFKKSIRQKISLILDIPQERVNIKAKTNNGLGQIGEKTAIACYAAVIVTKE